MNISVQKLLTKMEDELRLAKNASTDPNLREKIYSIKILCELILDEKSAAVTPPAPQPVVAPQPVFQPAPASINQPKKLEMDDEANGDSLFDF